MKKNQMEKEKFKLGLLNGLIVPRVGRSGGLAILWDRDVKVEVQSYSGYFIDAFGLIRTLASSGASSVFMGTQKLIGEKSRGIC